MAKVIIPVSIPFALVLLLKGHNDPGGGFVAGLSLGVTAMIIPLDVPAQIVSFDGWVMLGAALALVVFAYTGLRVGRPR